MSNIVSSYNDKYNGIDDRLSVMQILQKVGTTEYKQSVIKEYEAVGIEQIKIDGNVFNNYGQYSFIWEKNYIKSPERSSNGSISNLDTYATFVVPHLILDFSMISIDDYRKIMILHYAKNEHTVECYDTIYNKPITVNMYFATEEMAKLYTIAQTRPLSDGRWEEWVDLVGVSEYKVELIGTNSDLGYASVIYHKNPPPDTGKGDITTDAEYISRGGDVLIGSSASEITSETFDNTYVFSTWNTQPDGSGITYVNNYAYTINNDLVLYAQWKSNVEHILTFNYGVADTVAKESIPPLPTKMIVVQKYTVGILPYPDKPYVIIKDGEEEKKYYPYVNGKWYKTPIKADNSSPVTDNTPYWTNADSTIYLIYDILKFELVLRIDGQIYQGNWIEYNSPMNLPTLYKEGYKFDGWYTSPDYKEGTKVNFTTMPPYELNVYARWIKT